MSVNQAIYTVHVKTPGQLVHCSDFSKKYGKSVQYSTNLISNNYKKKTAIVIIILEIITTDERLSETWDTPW